MQFHKNLKESEILQLIRYANRLDTKLHEGSLIFRFTAGSNISILFLEVYMNKITTLGALLCIVFLSNVFGAEKNGFALENTLIPVSEIVSGGPPRDGIPSIDSPQFVMSSEGASLYTGTEKALVVEHNGIIKLYPVAILNWHEVVNDTIGGLPIVVTYCPLCGTGIVFERSVNGTILEFGVSGLLYQSDVLLYDRQTESLWSQLMFKAVSGQHSGTRLSIVHSSLVDIRSVLINNPDALVLSEETGYIRDYSRNPYDGYELTDRLYFSVNNPDDTYPSKTWSILIQSGTVNYIVTAKHFDSGATDLILNVDGREVTVEYDSKTGTLKCTSDESVVCVSGFYFALKTFYPDAVIP